jgi:hypothetical protein
MSDNTIFLKEHIQKLIDLEKEEEKYKNIFSNIKKEKEILNSNVINFMQKNNITEKDIIFGDKKIKYSTLKVQDNITKKLIYERLKIFLKDDVSANNATNFIYSDRNISEKNYLKISDIKIKKS